MGISHRVSPCDVSSQVYGSLYLEFFFPLLIQPNSSFRYGLRCRLGQESFWTFFSAPHPKSLPQNWVKALLCHLTSPYFWPCCNILSMPVDFSAVPQWRMLSYLFVLHTAHSRSSVTEQGCRTFTQLKKGFL